MATLILPKSRPAGGEARQSTTWHVKFYCRRCQRSHVISTLTQNKKEAQRKLAEFVLLQDRGELQHGVNPWLAERRKPTASLTDALAMYETDLRAGRLQRKARKPVSDEYAKMNMGRLRRVLTFSTVEQVTLDGVNARLDKMKIAPQTRKAYEVTLRTFSKWLVDTDRLTVDPLRKLKPTHVAKHDVVHARTALSVDQLAKIVKAAERGKPRYGLSGKQRAVLYLVACYTGLRAKECNALLRRDFATDWSSVVISGRHTKNGQEHRAFIPSWLRPYLAKQLGKLKPEDRLFPVEFAKHRHAGKMLRFDARKVLVVGRVGKEQNGGVIDFHSLRHAFASMADSAGVAEGTLRQMHRASSISLLERYTHRAAAALAEAAEKLPRLAGL